LTLKKLAALATLLLLATSLLLAAGCSSKSGPKYLRYSVGTEPETLDPRKSTGIPEATVEAQLFEGLTTLDAKNNPVPAMAEKWEISTDGLKYKFILRPGIKWSNGDPVTAYDFEYGWKTALSPELGSKYAYQLFYVKNGEAYNKGLTTADNVGVKALDDRTLEVVLEKPTAYFLSLTAFHTLYPVPRRIVEANPKWTADPKTLVGNGPFKIAAWIHNSRIELVKNDQYWDAAKVKMPKLDFILTESGNTELAMFDNNQIDMGDNAPPAEYPRLKKEGRLQISPYLGTYFFSYNVTKAPLDNLKVRQALTLALDRQAIIDNVTKGEQKAAFAWVPPGMADASANADFRSVGGDYFQDRNIDAAKKLLAEAGFPDGKGLPPIELIYNTSDVHKAIAEAVQEMWRKNLGVNVTINNQEWKVFINTRSKGDYQVARHGWIGDYADPMTFIDMFDSASGNNDSHYKNPQFDNLVRLAKSTGNQDIRMKSMHEAEKLLMEDAVIAPVYFYTRVMMVKPNVKGYQRSVLGHVYFKEAYVE
jgi:oligopeptide transport system substrate-binding protein